MFKSVRVTNFRAITDLKVDGLSRVNLFVGHNASGKTTFLESVFFLIGATNPRLPVNVNAFRGLPWMGRDVWRTYFHNMKSDKPIEIIGDDVETGVQHRLLIRPRERYSGPSNESASSTLSSSWMRTVSEAEVQVNGLRFEYSGSTDGVPNQVSEVYLKGDELVVEGMEERPIRGTFVIPLALDMIGRFSEIQRRKQIPEVVALLKEIEPAVEDLRLGEPSGTQIWADIGAPEMMPVNLMGGGATKFLNVALSMLDFQNGFVLIDEIENGLHYAAQKKLWDAIFNWAQKLNVQVFASTHSMECIKAFTDCATSGLFGPDAMLFRIERRGDRFRVVEYTREVLAESLESEWEVR